MSNAPRTYAEAEALALDAILAPEQTVTLDGETFEALSDYYARQRFDEALDECNEWATVGGSEYAPSSVLKECDPIAYRVGFGDYADSLAEDGVLVQGYTLEDSIWRAQTVEVN